MSPREVLTVNPSLVTCLKLQHRAAPTERNLVNALRVATGDWKARQSMTEPSGSTMRFVLASLHSWKGDGRYSDVGCRFQSNDVLLAFMVSLFVAIIIESLS